MAEDIGKWILNERARDRDPEGYADDLEPWSESVAQARAREEGIDLTDEHWEVIRFLREHFLEHGQVKSGRVMAQMLEERFSHPGRRHLYELFPNGPVTQGSLLAGVPLPPYTVDRSFGSSE